MNLRELVETVDVPPTRVAEDAWERARGRVVRRRVAAAAGVGAVAAVVTVWLVAAPSGGPLPGLRHLDPADGRPPAPTNVDVTRPDWDALEVSSVPAPEPDAPALSTDPVERASLVMADPHDETGAYVLGDDGEWRHLDVGGLEPVTAHDGYESPFLRPTSLSSDGTQLALPQPDALVVVDLTTGGSERYDVPGSANTYAIWQDATHVLVAEENRLGGTMVDLATGNTETSAFGRATRFLPDGSALTWEHRSPMTWDDGREVPSVANNSGNIQSPLVSDDVVVGLHAKDWLSSDVDAAGDPGLETLGWYNGVAAVDASDGHVLGFLMPDQQWVDSTMLLGWAGDLPVIGLARVTDESRTYVVTWDYRAGTLQPLAVLPGWYVSWGAGL